jgi:hypothetical protein
MFGPRDGRRGGRAAKEKENETKPLTLLEIAKRAGITFPRPSHWPANRKSDLFKFHDEVEK